MFTFNFPPLGPEVLGAAFFLGKVNGERVAVGGDDDARHGGVCGGVVGVLADAATENPFDVGELGVALVEGDVAQGTLRDLARHNKTS